MNNIIPFMAVAAAMLLGYILLSVECKNLREEIEKIKVSMSIGSDLDSTRNTVIMQYLQNLAVDFEELKKKLNIEEDETDINLHLNSLSALIGTMREPTTMKRTMEESYRIIRQLMKNEAKDEID